MTAPDLTLTRRIVLEGNCNTPDEVIIQHVAANIRRGLPQAQPFAPNAEPVLLVCGGPSLRATERELVDAHWAGGKIFAVNGAYQWCIDRNLRPSAAIMLDARAFNARFIATPVDRCRYLLASQCHPDAFDLCRDRDTTIWHACSTGDGEHDLLKAFYFDRTYPVTLGTTVGLRAISLLRMLGFFRFDVFGLDSCFLDESHHAYPQTENDHDKRIGVWLRPEGRDDKAERFECAPWMVQQAHDFMSLVRQRGDNFDLNVRGPGLIASIIRTGAELVEECE